MQRTLSPLALLAAAVLAPTALAATDVRVVIRGTVERNDFTAGTFLGVGANDPVRIQIDLDSANYLNSAALPGRVRGYRFLPANFSMTAGSVNVGLRPSVTSAFFCVRNNDPGVDGFFISTGTDIDDEIPLDMTPTNYGIAFLRTFSSNAIWNTLDLLPICGHYGFEFMSSYNFTVQRGEFSVPLIVEYQSISLTHCPSIQAGPVNAQACRGEPATFSVTADGTSPAYQWQIETQEGWQNLDTTPTTLPCGGLARIASGSGAGVGIAVDGCESTSGFNVRCIVSNDCGTVTSDPAVLEIQTCTPPCPADFNSDGGVDGADIEAFFTVWETGNSSADVNADGGVDGSDIETFFAAWEAGGC